MDEEVDSTTITQEEIDRIQQSDDDSPSVWTGPEEVLLPEPRWGVFSRINSLLHGRYRKDAVKFWQRQDKWFRKSLVKMLDRNAVQAAISRAEKDGERWHSRYWDIR